jgi:predicted enzyme related to lactoylglutathione lyase
MTRRVAAAREYYADLYGWHFETTETDVGPYYVALAHGRPVAGIVDLAAMPALEEMPPHWIAYVAVDDLEAAIAETTAAGGETLRAPLAVPDVGRVAIVRDPSGAALGLVARMSEWDPADNGDDTLENLPV